MTEYDGRRGDAFRVEGVSPSNRGQDARDTYQNTERLILGPLFSVF
ncbi:hypothetical protein ACFL5Z_15250 [Planctomycetota bacterium]